MFYPRLHQNGSAGVSGRVDAARLAAPRHTTSSPAGNAEFISPLPFSLPYIPTLQVCEQFLATNTPSTLLTSARTILLSPPIPVTHAARFFAFTCISDAVRAAGPGDLVSVRDPVFSIILEVCSRLPEGVLLAFVDR